ncbi:MAG: 16S rRNA (uracil(1498)-N(3))-methyltransferase [Bacteroidaceae bacterium]|nr:16S rRNA (uracil(1498)-N(3))-methyltransferase [Bacteroidaceae bacterium]
MHLFYAPDIETIHELPTEEAQHCIRVLRQTEGDELFITDGKGSFYRALISMITSKRCFVEIQEKNPQPPLFKAHLHIALAPTKNMSRVEWMVEKSTEIGISEISFLRCRFSERKEIKIERIEKIVVSAMKQSLKAEKPILNAMQKFATFIQQPFEGQKFIAHCYEGEKPLLKDIIQPEQDALLLVGPEGDFSEEEVAQAVANGYVAVSLGKARLRTETAGLVGCHILNLANQN